MIERETKDEAIGVHIYKHAMRIKKKPIAKGSTKIAYFN